MYTKRCQLQTATNKNQQSSSQFIHRRKNRRTVSSLILPFHFDNIENNGNYNKITIDKNYYY
jgi:hypothetical protein